MTADPSPSQPPRGSRGGGASGGRGGSGKPKGGGKPSRQGQPKGGGKPGTQGQPTGGAKPGRPGGGKGGKGGQRGRPDQQRHDGRDETAAQLAGPLRRVLERLPETQRRVLEYRMGLVDGHPHDLADTARALGLSMSEAREIEKRAFEHIREAVPLQQLQRFLDR